MTPHQALGVILVFAWAALYMAVATVNSRLDSREQAHAVHDMRR